MKRGLTLKVNLEGVAVPSKCEHSAIAARFRRGCGEREHPVRLASPVGTHPTYHSQLALSSHVEALFMGRIILVVLVRIVLVTG